MKNKEFAIFNCISQKEADQILDWLLENFDEKDIEKIADILSDAVKKSAATINNLYSACFEIKKINPDFNDLGIIEDLKKMANLGMRASTAGKKIARIIKKINHENLD